MGKSQVPLGCETQAPRSSAYSSLVVLSVFCKARFNCGCKAGLTARGLTVDVICFKCPMWSLAQSLTKIKPSTDPGNCHFHYQNNLLHKEVYQGFLSTPKEWLEKIKTDNTQFPRPGLDGS